MESGFASVWNRVTGSAPPEDAAIRLRRWIRDEAQGVRAYEALLRMVAVKTAHETIRQILSDERMHLKRLQTMYYLHTGDICLPEVSEEPKPNSLLQGLRSQYARELSQAESLGRAGSGGSDLEALFSELAEDKRKIAARLRGLVERLL